VKPNTKHLFALIGMVTLLLSLPVIVKSQDGTWNASHANQLMSEMQNAYNTFLQFVDQGQADTPAGQQAFAAYDSARIRFCDYVAAAPTIDEAYADDEEARRAWEEFKRLRAQGKTDEVGEPRNRSMSDLIGDDVEDPLESTYGVFCLTTPPPGYERGVQISFRVAADGYEPRETAFYIEDYAPSSIKIWGTVTNEKGEPIPGATVTLADPSKTETTDASGSYQLYVETVGTKPYEDKLDWVLETKVSAVNIDVKPPDIIPVPGEVPLSITATDQDGQPLKNATVIITLVDGHKMPFLTIGNDRAWLDEKGQFSTKLTTRDPAGMDYVHLTDIPLEATISVEIKDREESNTLGQTEVKRPFNLALIHGVTVDSDLKPIKQEFVPEVQGITEQMVFAQEKNLDGDFWVLVRTHHPRSGQSIQELMDQGSDFRLEWDIYDNLPLVYSIEKAPEPGKLLELGKVGKTPWEKIKEWYVEFGTTPHTWPDGTTEKTPLVGPHCCGAVNNAHTSFVGGESERYDCVDMQYKTLWFLNELANRKAEDCTEPLFLCKLKGWDYAPVNGVCLPYPEHNAVALWDRAKWKASTKIPAIGSDVIILDPHGEQKPYWYSADTVLFSWEVGNKNQYEPEWVPPWSKPKAKQPKKQAMAVDCPVDVLITNSRGQRLGVLPNGDRVAEFEPMDSYFWQDEQGDKQWFFALPEDTYEVKLIGTGSGEFHLLTSALDGKMHDYGVNPVTAGEQATLIMDPEGDKLVLADGKTPAFEVISPEPLGSSEPTISNLQPADGAIVRADPSTISADYADNPGGSGIDADAVTIMMDGVDRTAEATVTGSSIRLEPGQLAKGPHEVTVVVADREGNQASVSWWFEVQEGTNTLYYGLGLVAALLMGVIGVLGLLFLRGGLEPALAPLASQATAIRQQVQTGYLHPSQVRALTGQDRQGRRWSLDPLQERWQLWTGAAWQPARPPLARRWGCVVGGLSALGLGGLLGLLVVGLLISGGLPQTPSIASATATALHQYVPTATSISAPLPSAITPTPQAGLLPDLVIAHAGVTMRGYTGGCVTESAPLVTEVCVENRGAAAAGPFVIQAGDGAQWPVERLAAGEQRCLEGESDASGQIVTVDADDAVAESDETNNTLMVPIPTPPAICTPSPVSTPGATSPPAEAEFVRILAVEVPDQVNTGQSFTISVRLGWSYTEKGTFQVTVRSDSSILGQSGSPGFVVGQDEYTVQYALTAPAEPGPFQFMVEVDGATPLSPSLQDRRDVSVNIIAPSGQAELDADTAQTILPSADEIGVDRLDFTDFVMPDEGAGFGALPVFRVSSQDTVVDLMVLASANDAGRFINQTFSDYQSMGSPPTWTDLGDESFSRQGEVLVRVDRYILWALGGMSPDQLRPSVQRLQTLAGGGS
jgi:hypothetical protein